MFSWPANRGLTQFYVVIVLVPVFLCPALGHADTFRRSWPVMGTYAEFVSDHDSRALNRRGEQAVREVFRRINETMTVYNDSSDVSRINENAGHESVVVDPWLVDVLRKGKRGARMTSGAFSLNVLAYGVKLGLKPGAVGSYDFPPVDDSYVLIEPSRNRVLLKKQGMGIDLGGIAKGYALDRAVRRLRSLGLSRFLISLGRNTYAGVPPKSSEGWPVKLVGEGFPRRLARQFVSVSEQGIQSDTGHIVDPRSGRVVPDRRRVVVISTRGWIGDVLSTGLMVDPGLYVESIRRIKRVDRVIIQEK